MVGLRMCEGEQPPPPPGMPPGVGSEGRCERCDVADDPSARVVTCADGWWVETRPSSNIWAHEVYGNDGHWSSIHTEFFDDRGRIVRTRTRWVFSSGSLDVNYRDVGGNVMRGDEAFPTEFHYDTDDRLVAWFDGYEDLDVPTVTQRVEGRLTYRPDGLLDRTDEWVLYLYGDFDPEAEPAGQLFTFTTEYFYACEDLRSDGTGP